MSNFWRDAAPHRGIIINAFPHMIKLILGLGNPGARYAKTYHNAGRLTVQALLKISGAPEAELRATPWFSYAKTSDGILAESKVFMNHSGRAARAALKLFHLTPAELLVVQDDSDLALGKTKLVFGRGAAGHHGVESIIQELGSNQFWRLRIGTRARPGKAGEFALRRMSPAYQKIIYGAAAGLMAKVKEKTRPGGVA